MAFDRIWALVERGHSGIAVVFRPGDRQRWSQLDDAAVLPATDTARLRANDSTSEEGTESWAVSPSPYGPVMILDEAGDEEEARTWFGVLAAALAEAGLSGTVDVAEHEHSEPSWVEARAAVPKLTAYTAFRLPLPTAPDRAWHVDPVTTGDLCRRVAAWAGELRDARTVLTQSLSTAAVDDVDPALLASAAALTASAGMRSSRADPLAVRSSHLDAWGQVVHVVDDTSTWPEQLETLRRIAFDRPDLLDLAVVRLSPTWARSWQSLALGHPVLPGADAFAFLRSRNLWSQYTVDAHGVQILTSAHLSRAHDLADWEIRELAPDRHLVVARDLGPWFAEGEPDGEVVAAARRDFGDMIMTPDVTT